MRLVSRAALLLLAASTAYGQLEPQYIPASTADSVTCYPADQLQWRSIPGKIVVHGAPLKPKPKPKPAVKPPQPIAPGPDEEAPAAAVDVTPGGGLHPPVPKPPVQVKPPQPHMAPVNEAAVQAMRRLQEAEMQGEKVTAVVDGVEHEVAEEMSEEDKATIARQSLYAQIQLKGLNWFGLDRINIFEGTNYKTIDEVMTFFVDHKINAIRLPFSLEFALTPMDIEEEEAGGGMGELQYPDRDKISPEYYGLTSWEIIDLLFDKAAENGILVLLDMHTLDPEKGVSRLWYDPEKYSEATVLWGWERIVLRYADHWNLFALDIMNECHDHASWGKGDPETDFNEYVQRFILFMDKHVPQFQGLFFVEGIFLNGMGRDASPWPYWWGGNLFGADQHPIDVKIAALNDRVVYAPHIYGPDVFDMDYFKTPRFPNNVFEVWDNQYGWLIKSTRKALVVGEWGGSCNGKDGIVQQKLAEWMIQNCFQSNFWWALNPGSADTDGLMSQDWTKYDERKMTLLDFVQPDPSQFTYNKKDNTVCIRHGEAPNPQCRDNLDHVLNPPPPSVGQQGYAFVQNAWAQGMTRLRGAPLGG